MRVTIHLQCTECKEINYLSSKNKKNNPERIEKNKFCARCNKQTLHREKR